MGAIEESTHTGTVYREFLSPKNNLNHTHGDLRLYTADSFMLHCVRTAYDNTSYVLILPVSLSVPVTDTFDFVFKTEYRS